MKRRLILVAALCVGVAEQSMAACSGTRIGNCPNNEVNPIGIKVVLNGKTVCGRPGPGYAGSASDRWQEYHADPGPCTDGTTGNGTVTDYKRGPTDTVDPSKVVGSWGVTVGGGRGGTRQVTYNYLGGSSYTYDLWENGNVYSFCVGNSERVVAFLQPGSGPCTSYP